MLKRIRSALLVSLASVLIGAYIVPSTSAVAYSQPRTRRATARARTPYAQGYQKGYGNGYLAGLADWKKGVPRDFQHSVAAQPGNQVAGQGASAPSKYRDGYDVGFELGYTDGYYGRARNAALPPNAELERANLARAASADQSPSRGDSVDQPPARADSGQASRRADYPPAPSYNIPGDTELRLKLNSAIDTRTSRRGDRFTAAVLSPSDYEGATIEGHIANVQRSSRVSGKTELGLAFDRIIFQDGTRRPIDAQLERVIRTEAVKKVDEEGNIESQSRTTESEKRGAIGAAAGAIIGGIAGGGKGALIGILIGGAAGVGTVYVEGNNDLILDTGAELVIRTAGRSATR
jgi:hypothetical protein